MQSGCIAGIDVHKKMLAVVVRRERDGQFEYASKWLWCKIQNAAWAVGSARG